MLTERLLDRCPNAKPKGVAFVENHYLSFGKKGRDDSGKATLVKSNDKNDRVYGVLYELGREDSLKLDKYEYNYIRDDVFSVNFEGKIIEVLTYYISEKDIEVGLIPMDWYKNICVAGARKHGIDEAYIQQFENLISRKDPDNPAHKYLEDLKI